MRHLRKLLALFLLVAVPLESYAATMAQFGCVHDTAAAVQAALDGDNAGAHAQHSAPPCHGAGTSPALDPGHPDHHSPGDCDCGMDCSDMASCHGSCSVNAAMAAKAAADTLLVDEQIGPISADSAYASIHPPLLLRPPITS